MKQQLFALLIAGFAFQSCKTTLAPEAKTLSGKTKDDAAGGQFERAARGLVACYEANGRLNEAYDESGQCGDRFVREESIWVRQSKNPTIKATVTSFDQFPPYAWTGKYDGGVSFINKAKKACKFSFILTQTDEDAHIMITDNVECIKQKK